MPPGPDDIITTVSRGVLNAIWAEQIAGRMVELPKGLSPEFLEALPDEVAERTDLHAR